MTLNDFPEALWVSPVANVVFQRPHSMSMIAMDELTKPQYATFHPEALSITRKFFKDIVLKQEPEVAPERIFIKRLSGRQYHARSILNESEIQMKLESEGFVSIDPSALSFSEQILFFSKAKYIVAASGAALLNMMWSPGGAKVIVLMNDSKVANYWYFSNIAFSVGHNLSYVLGRIVNTGNWNDIHHADFDVDVDAVVSALENYDLQFMEQSTDNVVLKNILTNAKLHQRSGLIDEAVKAYHQILDIDSEHAEANYNLALIETQLYGAKVAAKRFERAAFAKPEKEQYWVSYIESMIDSGSVESVVNALDFGMKHGLRASVAHKLAAGFIAAFDGKH